MAKLYPDRGQMLPDIALDDSTGRLVNTDSYRQRSNLVIVLVGSLESQEQRLLQGLAQDYSSIAEDETEVIAVVQGSSADADRLKRDHGLPFPVLVDEDGRIHRSLGAESAEGKPATAVYVADRFGEIYRAFRARDGAPVPDSKEIFTWLDFIEVQCPECGAPEWRA